MRGTNAGVTNLRPKLVLKLNNFSIFYMALLSCGQNEGKKVNIFAYYFKSDLDTNL
jgi:hypothetical protein